RELHDVVAHQLSAIAVQAGAARIAAGGGQDPGASSQGPAAGPDQVRVLATVERLAREALTELNHLLGALRRERADDPAHRPSPPRPASGGRGVRGMRERAELYGGSLDARPCAGGGFAVTAAIPCDPVPEPA